MPNAFFFGEDFDHWLTDDNPEIQTPSTQVGVHTYAATKPADKTYEYSNVPSLQTNDCHDDISDTWVKIYFTQQF